ncbi:hypothetical protein C8Q76DRAFT_703549 [Earliella scabrosa]|nr:hypothetical protein C8Q76DRAFT_703549 [Earliella scabrosa]
MSAGTIPNVPANVTCTDCFKAQYGIVAQTYGDFIPGSVSSELSNTCGASFLGMSIPLCECDDDSTLTLIIHDAPPDGSMPATVTQLASDSGSSTTVTPNGAAPSFSSAPIVGLVASSLLAVSSAFALLA